MEKKEIIQKTLENLKVEASENNVFIFETLLKNDNTKRIDLVNTLKTRGLSDLDVKNILNALNKANVVKWEVVKCVAIIRLTKRHAVKEYVFALASATGEKYSDKLQEIVDSGEKAIKGVFDEVRDNGDVVIQKLRKKFSKNLRKLASKIESKK